MSRHQARQFPVLLDITRLLSRAGLPGALTGVDRVEMAYLDWCLRPSGQPMFALARLAEGYAVLDRTGAAHVLAAMQGKIPWGRRDLRAHLRWPRSPRRGAAQAAVRRLAVARSSKARLPELMGAGQGGWYLNVGHSNLSRVTLAGMAETGLRVGIFVHDVIPLDYPQFQRPETVAKFRQNLSYVRAFADAVLTNSRQTQARLYNHLGAACPIVPLHLGLPEQPVPKAARHPHPYFVAVGTIEPRKNHQLLLDVWDALERRLPAEKMPHLYIVGRRGWCNEAVFSQLDRLRSKPWLHEENGMDDAALHSLLAGARALLFPSFAEGFGLPLLEAAQQRVPVICGELPICREILGNYPVYLDLSKGYLWQNTVETYAECLPSRCTDMTDFPPIPRWEDHFAALSTALSDLPERVGE